MMKKMNFKKTTIALLGAAIVLMNGSVAYAANPSSVNLGTAGNYAILAQTGVSTVPTSAVTGNIGVSPVAASYITGFSLVSPVIVDAAGNYSTSPQVTGKIYAADYNTPTNPTPANLTTAVGDMGTAYTDASSRAPDFTELATGNIGGLTMTSGVYKWGTGVTIPTNVTLSGGANDVFIFVVAQDITMAAGKSVILSGGAQAKNIFWVVAGQVTLGTGAHFEGIVLSKTAIHLNTGASINGRLLAQTAVTLDQSVVTAPATSASVTLSSEKTITAFSVLGSGGVFNGNNISVNVPYGTNVTALVPTVMLSGGTVSPLSGAAHDFTAASTYTVTAQDNSTKTYTVTVIVSANTTVTTTPPTPTPTPTPAPTPSPSTGGSNVNPGSQAGVTLMTTSVGTVGCMGGEKFSTVTGKPCAAANGQQFGAAVSLYARSLSRGSRGDDVSRLQQRLLDEHVYTGPVTGYFGPLTAKGVMKYQAKMGIAQVGMVGPLTRASLNK